MANADSIVGGWGDAHVPTAEELNLFARATGGRVGAKLEPLAVQSQVVNGVNYCFYCISIPITLTPLPVFVRVHIYSPPNGIPVVESISSQGPWPKPTGLAGGWSGVRTLSQEDVNEFKEAMEGWTGVGYQPLAVESQVVAGINFCYFSIGTLVYREPSSFMAVVDIFAALNRKPVIQEITRIHPW